MQHILATPGVIEKRLQVRKKNSFTEDTCTFENRFRSYIDLAKKCIRKDFSHGTVLLRLEGKINSDVTHNMVSAGKCLCD